MKGGHIPQWAVCMSKGSTAWMDELVTQPVKSNYTDYTSRKLSAFYKGQAKMYVFIIMDYDVWFIVRDCSVSLHLLVP